MIGIVACHSGNLLRAETDLALICAFGRPIADIITQKRYVGQQSMLNATKAKSAYY